MRLILELADVRIDAVNGVPRRNARMWGLGQRMLKSRPELGEPKLVKPKAAEARSLGNTCRVLVAGQALLNREAWLQVFSG